MAYASAGLRAPSAPSLLSLSGVFAALRRRRIERQTYDALSALTDRDLDDLGLRRDDIPAAARKSAAAY